MSKKTFAIITLIAVLLLNLEGIVNALKVKAQTETLIEVPLPSPKDLDSVLEQEPAVYENIDSPEYWGEVMVCSTGIYQKITSWINTALSVVLNPVCQMLGRTLSFLGIGGTAISGECIINTGGADTTQQCKEWVAKKKATLKAKMAEMTKLLLRIAVKTFMDRLVSNAVDWISGRTTGDPQFVTNWRQFFGDVMDEAFGRFIENSPFSELCEPFRYLVRVGTTLPGKPPFPTCTLSRVVSNIESFYDNFSNGGWLAFEESFYPWNNAFGAYLMTQESLKNELSESQQEAEKKTQSGYKPTEWCIKTKKDPATGQEICVEKVVSIPGEAKSDLTSKVLTNQLEKSDSYFLTSADLKGYSEMIAQALISRLLKSAKELLIGGKWYGKGLLALPEKGDSGPSLNLRYACKTYGGSKVCEIDANGPYFSKESCEAVCTGSTLRFKCDTELQICVADPNGSYSDYDSCSRVCYPSITPSPPPSENRYSCNEVEGLCELDPNGDFTSLTSCQKYCGGREPSPPPQY
ncbi:MAG: hypothetical protein ACP5IX_00315 [Patescibacteria group bacterium]